MPRSPDPAQHAAHERASVVVRMKQNMESAGKPVPDDKTTKLIIGFCARRRPKELRGFDRWRAYGAR